MKKAVIFDFDGTLADSMEKGLELLNMVLKDEGIKTISHEKLEELRHKSYRDMLSEFKVPIWKVPRIAKKVRDSIANHLESITPYPHIKELLEILNNHGFYLYVLTSNNRSTVLDFLNRYSISVMEDVYSERNIFGKARGLKKVLKRIDIPVEHCIYVGDEVRDVEACKSIGMDVISVAWGFHAPDRLTEAEPTYLARTPKDILRFLKK